MHEHFNLRDLAWIRGA